MAENPENSLKELDPGPSEEFKLPKEEIFEPLDEENGPVYKEEEHTMEKLEIKGTHMLGDFSAELGKWSTENCFFLK